MTTLEAETGEKVETQEEILDRLRLFVTQGRTAENMADQGSLDRAADVVKLYEAKEWMDKLPPITIKRNRGKPVDPESFSRFSKWLAGETGLTGPQAYRLRNARNIQVNYCASGTVIPSGEFVLRPLNWLVKNGYEDAVTTVWEQAVEIAGGDSPKSPDVKKALAEWKKETFPKAERTTSEKRTGQAAVDKLMRDAHRIMEEYPELFVDAINKIEEDAEKFFAGSTA